MRSSSYLSSIVAVSSNRSARRSRIVMQSAALTALAVIGAGQPALAVVNLFGNYSNNNLWEDANNWETAALPTTGDRAYIEQGFTVNTSSPDDTCEEMQVGVGPNAYDAVGNPGGSGTLNILSGGTITTTGNMVVGQAQSAAVDSSGTINIATGGTLKIGGGASLIGFFGDNNNPNAPTKGTINVNGGTFNWAAGNDHATLWIGGNSDTNRVGTGFVNLNSGIATGGAIRVGDFGTGTLNVAGGTLTSNFYMAIGLGNNPNTGHGTVNITGGILNLAQITLNENKSEECVINQSAGTVNVGGVHGLDGYNFRIGYSDHGKATYNMTGGTLNVSGNDLYVGRGQTGEFNISGNSAVNVNTLVVDDRPNNDFGIALGGIDNGNATINQNGGTVFIAPTSLLGVFYHGHNGGSETYNLKGGTLTTNGITAEGGSTVKTFNFDGGALIANKSLTVPNQNPNFNSTANFFTTLSSGGGTINTAGFDVTWLTPLTGAGALAKTGAGTLTLSGANTYAGGTTISGGTLLVNNNSATGATGSGTISVAAGGTLGGGGTVVGGTSVSGTLSPGAVDSTGALAFGATLAINAGAKTSVQLKAASDFDRVTASGAATIGGTIDLSTLNGYVPAYGQTHRVLDAATLSGRFAKVTGLKLTSKKWLAVTYDAVGVSVTAALPGDANLSANVNFDDLIVLAQNYNGTNKGWAQGDFDGSGNVNFDDLIPLAQNYNQSAIPGGAQLPAAFAADWALAQSLVPEPMTAMVLAAPLLLTARRRRLASC